jgi:hypothetical protein
MGARHPSGRITSLSSGSVAVESAKSARMADVVPGLRKRPPARPLARREAAARQRLKAALPVRIRERRAAARNARSGRDPRAARRSRRHARHATPAATSSNCASGRDGHGAAASCGCIVGSVAFASGCPARSPRAANRKRDAAAQLDPRARARLLESRRHARPRVSSGERLDRASRCDSRDAASEAARLRESAAPLRDHGRPRVVRPEIDDGAPQNPANRRRSYDNRGVKW